MKRFTLYFTACALVVTAFALLGWTHAACFMGGFTFAQLMNYLKPRL